MIVLKKKVAIVTDKKIWTPSADLVAREGWKQFEGKDVESVTLSVKGEKEDIKIHGHVGDYKDIDFGTSGTMTMSFQRS